MASKAGIVGLGLGAGAVILLLLTGKAKAASAPADAGPSASDKKGADEAQTLASMLTCSASNSPSVLDTCANQIRNYPWTHPEVRAEAYQWASNLNAKAQDIRDAQQAELDASMGQG